MLYRELCMGKKSNKNKGPFNNKNEGAVSLSGKSIGLVEDFTNMSLTLETKIVELLRNNSLLLDFTKEFYDLLLKANQKKEIFARTIKDERLEALSRLLVGDETCIALALDQERMLIASNRNNHNNEGVSLDIDFLIQRGSSYNNGLSIIINGRVSIFKGLRVIKEFAKNVGAFNYNYNNIDKLIPSKREFSIAIEPFEHLIQSLPVLKFSFCLADMDKNQLDLSLKNSGIKNPAHFVVRRVITIQAPIPKTYLDPLRRRIQIVLEYLAFICHINTTNKEHDRVKAKEALKQQRKRILAQSLAWEVAQWVGENKQLRAYADKADFKQSIDEFIDAIYEDFCSYKDTDGIPERLKKIKHKMRNSEIQSLPMLGSRAERVLKNFGRCLKDIAQLELFVEEDIKHKGCLSSFLIKNVNPRLPCPVFILDDLEDNIHAEMRILWHSDFGRKKLDYIAISKLCCAHCSLVMQQFKITYICGWHGKAYPNWIVSQKFINHKDFLKNFLGQNLYDKYDSLRTKTMMFDEKEYLGTELALLIIKWAAVLSEKTLKELAIADEKIRGPESSESEFPDESNEKKVVEQENKSYLEELQKDYHYKLKTQKELIAKLNSNMTDYEIINKFKDLLPSEEQFMEKKCL